MTKDPFVEAITVHSSLPIDKHYLELQLLIFSLLEGVTCPKEGWSAQWTVNFLCFVTEK